MIDLGNDISFIDVTAENVAEVGIYCAKDKKSPGFKAKVEWFTSKCNKGLKIKIAVNSQNKYLAYIEYIPSERAWRPVKAENYLFIHCIVQFAMETRGRKIGSYLIQQCEEEARKLDKAGICVMTSDGVWIANKSLFEKNGYEVADTLDRFELMFKSFTKKESIPSLIDWREKLPEYQGWHLVYSDQCPWHAKSVKDLKGAALKNGTKLKIKKLITPEEAQSAPTGFGTFGLIYNGELLADHYISKTRFENIVRKVKIQKSET